MTFSLVFYGTPDFSVPALKCLVECPSYRVAAVVTQPDRLSGRGRKLSEPPVKTLAKQHGIPVLQPESIRRGGQDFINSLNTYGPFDVGIVIAFGQILPQAVLDVPQRGCINIHASLLPRWRGAAPIQRALMSGDQETGVCVMRMDAGLDTGPVFACRRHAIQPDDNAARVHDALAQHGAELLLEYLPQIASGILQAQPQADQGVTYASKILAEEACIDWSQSAMTVHNLIRGLAPSPGAYTMVKGLRLRVLASRPVHPERTASSNCRCGTVCTVTDERIAIQCGSGLLELLEVQLEGRKRLPVKEFLLGFSIAADTTLG